MLGFSGVGLIVSNGGQTWLPSDSDRTTRSVNPIPSDLEDSPQDSKSMIEA